jgi:hypothetical protein
MLKRVNLTKTLFPPASCLIPTTNIYAVLLIARVIKEHQFKQISGKNFLSKKVGTIKKLYEER